jgi:predicted HicB family RNase H-like nuclease
MSTLEHQGYIALIELDADDGMMSGRVVNTRAVLYFEGATVRELQDAFAETIADYRAQCAADGIEPEKPFSGQLSLRLTPDLHRRIATLAAKRGKSINATIAEVLENVA